MLHFGLAACQKLGTLPTNFDILEDVCGHGTISVDAGPFYVIKNVGPMSAVMM
jgi:hypothetical protein